MRRARPGRIALAISFVGLLALALPSSAQSSSGPCSAPQLPIAGARIVNVSTEAQLQSAVANAQAGDTIVLADGTYNLTSSLYVNGHHDVTIRGTDGCDNVVLVGKGMDNPNYGSVFVGIWSNSPNTTVAHLTIRDTYDNLLIFNPGAQAPHVYSVRLLNAGSQFIKSNPTDGPSGVGVDNGIVEYSWLEYTAGPPATDHGAGIGYTNGISAHAADGWVIRKNMFKNFHTPDSAAYLWNPAVLMWNHSANTVTEQNTFINVDRAIAYGLTNQSSGYDHQGGTIRNNFVYMAPGLFSASRKAGSDGQIIVWDSPDSKVYHNTILTNGNSASAIEFRFAATTGGEARNNLADAKINLRDGATTVQTGNVLTATSALFVNPAAGDLHLLSTATIAIDTAPALAAVTNDFDGDARPQGAGYDVGADEFVSTASSLGVSPSSLGFAKMAGQANPAAQSVTVTVPAGQAWSASTPASWVGLSPASGSGSGTIQVSPSIAMSSLAPGSYMSSITVTSAGLSADVALSVTVSPAGADTTVDFDNPSPPGSPGSRLALFGGIKWGKVWCWWAAEAGTDSTNHAKFCGASATSRTFTFSPGPKTLTSVTLVSSVAGTATLRDNNGQQITATLAPGQNVVVTPNWQKPSTWVRLSSAASTHMAITSLTYR